MNYIIIVTDCDCTVSFYSFHGTEKDMLSVLKKKAEERRQALAERPEYVTDIEYDELTSSWHINILSMGFSLLRTSEFFVIRKMEMSETKTHLLCGWSQIVIQKITFPLQ